MLIDNHGREVSYLRMAVTDRCNLRCLYCMPESGLPWVAREDLLSYEEMERLLEISAGLGISKVRFTGGEPFLRKGFIDFLERVAIRNMFSNISITTNGTLTTPFIDRLKAIGIASINLSLDTLDPKRFESMTRRNDFDAVMQCFHGLLNAGIDLKINAVIMDGRNEEDIVALSMLTKDFPIDVRFIEEMPFNGKGDSHAIKWNYKSILSEIESTFGALKSIENGVNSTSMNFQIEGHLGRVGVIPAYTRSFCGTCNRLRITPKGLLKTCLYSNEGTDLKALLRSGFSNQIVEDALLKAIGSRSRNGFEAEVQPATASMATIGG
jgi:molybdenum cofactor biosynthesis protein A